MLYKIEEADSRCGESASFFYDIVRLFEIECESYHLAMC